MDNTRQASEAMKCNQRGCEAVADYRFTWPGNDEAGICAEHAPKLRAIAGAMGFHIQIIKLDEGET